MAVTAQQLEILEAVVFAIAVDVMKLHAQRAPPPLGDPT
jgi:hypothetical protein